MAIYTNMVRSIGQLLGVLGVVAAAAMGCQSSFGFSDTLSSPVIVPEGQALKDIDDTNPCQRVAHGSATFTACRFEVSQDNLRLVHRDKAGELYGTFQNLKQKLDEDEQSSVVFAMNAGMYDPQWNPVGLYVEEGVVKKTANTKDGYGNFHLKPNGIFSIYEDENGLRRAGVMQTTAYLDANIDSIWATQSGPMLVIEGALHPKFKADSTSRKRRNGVGVSADGHTIWFAITDGPVNFHSFASFFRDRLKTPNALFLDGSISKLYAPGLGREDIGLPMGPIIVVTKPATEREAAKGQHSQ